MLDLILNPFVTLMALFYSILGNNIILAIVVLTVIIRLAMYPIFARQRVTMKKTSELQPKLKKLQEKYKDDREKLAQAQMELYREHGVNPLGGCFPLLLQFPIFIGLYNAIFLALSSTPQQLVDLSNRLLLPGLDGLIPLQNMWLGMSLVDPPSPPTNPAYALIMPLLVMATTYFQYKLSMANSAANKPDKDEEDDSPPNQAQAIQQSMGTVMPVMFGLISLSFSVGLSIYFITSNVVGIIQYSPIGTRYLDRLFGVPQDTPVEDKDKKDKDKKEADKPEKKAEKSSSSGKKRKKARQGGKK